VTAALGAALGASAGASGAPCAGAGARRTTRRRTVRSAGFPPPPGLMTIFVGARTRAPKIARARAHAAGGCRFCAPATAVVRDPGVDPACSGQPLPGKRRFSSPLRNRIFTDLQCVARSASTSFTAFSLMMMSFICSFRNKNEYKPPPSPTRHECWVCFLVAAAALEGFCCMFPILTHQGLPGPSRLDTRAQYQSIRYFRAPSSPRRTPPPRLSLGLCTSWSPHGAASPCPTRLVCSKQQLPRPSTFPSAGCEARQRARSKALPVQGLV
jgi:hypothetical protein